MHQSSVIHRQSNKKRLATKATLVSALVLSAFLAACGGGSGNKTTTTQTTPPPPAINKALWVANGTNVLEYIPSQLTPGTSAAVPHLINNSGVFGAPQGVAFDAAGDLWVIDGGTVAAGGTVAPGLHKFTPTQLAALGQTKNPVPNVSIASSAFKFPQQAVFDAAGNLWVSDNGANAVYMFTAAQLSATSGNVMPSITITSTPAFNGPLGIAFDAAGNLWVANNASTTIFEFSADKLPKSAGTVALTPDVTLSDDGKGSIQAPWALTFDAAGNLWSSNANPPNTVVEFAKANLTASGMPAPAVTLSPTQVNGNSTLVAPNGICFDNLGDLAAVSSAAPFGIPFFSKGQLGASGATVPSTFIVGPATTLNAPAGCNFGPVVN
ncbi:hypothetical protein [Paraburkholderia sp. CI3]|uniref:Vgb family protein n=1 Tax=Paraburkholderia sp. CI3 TaxID=2991060 RepID=UPI003D1CC069